MQITNPPSIQADSGKHSSVKAQGEWVSAAFADRHVWKRLDAELERAGGAMRVRAKR